MKEQELLQTQVSTLPLYDIEVLEPLEPQRSTSEVGTQEKLRPMRTMCLGDCAIPE